MRILLIGEYSRLHNSLKEGLEALGHEVLLIGTGDGFKNFPVDYNIDARWSRSGIPNFLRRAIFRIFRHDLAGLEVAWRFKAILPKLRNYDVVQLISEMPFQTNPSIEYRLIRKLSQQNHKMFVLSSGADSAFVPAAMNGAFKYSFLDPYLADKKLFPEYRHSLAYLKKAQLQHHKKVYAIATGIIATDYDYVIPLQGNPKFIGLVPNPVNTQKITYTALIAKDKVTIFLGINRLNYYKKGIPYFEKALEIIRQKYA